MEQIQFDKQDIMFVGGGEEEPEEGFRRESTVAEGDEQSTGKPTTDGKTVGKAGGKHPSGKPGKLKANAKI